MTTKRTQIGIIGAGPAGLFLAHLLAQAGIDTVVLEKHAREYVEGRVRAGVLEQITAKLMDRLGVGARMRLEGLVHRGVNISVDGAQFHIDFADLTDGATIIVYGQSEVMKDLGDAAAARGLTVVYEAEDVTLHDVASDKPFITYATEDGSQRLDCDFIVGCDGFHGPARGAIPTDKIKHFEREYPFGWLGILADVPPCADELIYANHTNGFALASMRSPSRSRYYLQCALDEKIENWSDERFWDELCVRLGPEAATRVTRGPSFEKSIAPLRSYVCEPMRYGKLFLAGDAAHIVPPTGAKGLNLAVSDVIFLSQALVDFYTTNNQGALDSYSTRALARVWKAERFSWWFTGITHRFPSMDAFDRKMQLAELDYIRGSRAAQTALAENYVGLPEF
jgi:p-hydroxybenzoate 3-monooxygenase